MPIDGFHKDMHEAKYSNQPAESLCIKDSKK